MFRYFLNYIKLLAKIRANNDCVIFYSEGSHHWFHIKDLLLKIKKTERVLFVTSSIEEYNIKSNSIESFVIGEGLMRNLFFKNVKCKFFITSMPDLGLYPFIKSLNVKSYIYLFHSMVSTHMAYRNKAFDNFDIILCCGEHHIRELRKKESIYNLKPKKLLKYGYYLLDELKKFEDTDNSITIAPTWGENSIFENKIDELEGLFKIKDYKFTLRPHPETLKRKQYISKQLFDLSKTYNNVKIDLNLINLERLSKSNMLITDYSGVAFDFAFGFKRPVIFLEGEKKINNFKYKDIDIVPIEIEIRKQIGLIVSNITSCEIKKAIKTIENNLVMFKRNISYFEKKLFFNSEERKKNIVKNIS